MTYNGIDVAVTIEWTNTVDTFTETRTVRLHTFGRTHEQTIYTAVAKAVRNSKAPPAYIPTQVEASVLPGSEEEDLNEPDETTSED